MQITIHFYSYCRDLAGCAETIEPITTGETIGSLWSRIALRFPRLAPMGNSILFAVAVDYQGRDYVLQDGDQVSIFPPVQGG